VYNCRCPGSASPHLPIIVAPDAPHHLIVPAFRAGERRLGIAPRPQAQVAVELVESEPAGGLLIRPHTAALSYSDVSPRRGHGISKKSYEAGLAGLTRIG
jgi:hypothetical protein